MIWHILFLEEVGPAQDCSSHGCNGTEWRGVCEVLLRNNPIKERTTIARDDYCAKKLLWLLERRESTVIAISTSSRYRMLLSILIT